jgi:hypothetical protein
MSRWVSTIIVLTEAQDLRTLLINNFIIIALVRSWVKSERSDLTPFFFFLQKCWELNNFSGVMEIISGLEAAPIQRLTNTWSVSLNSDLTSLFDNVNLSAMND